MTQQTPEPLQKLWEEARQRAANNVTMQRVAELARTIDEITGEMGVAAFRDAIRSFGYDVDADLGMLFRRGVDRFQH